MKITYLGDEIYRDKKGRFSRRRIWLWIVLGLSLLGFHLYFNNWYATEVSYIAPKVVYADVTMESKVDELKEDILNRLQACESAGHVESDAIIILEKNGQVSLGTFQFYRPTVIHYYSKLYGKEITMKEAATIAFDDVQARNLARDIIFKVEGGVFEWVRCAEKTGIVPEIEVIKKLTK